MIRVHDIIHFIDKITFPTFSRSFSCRFQYIFINRWMCTVTLIESLFGSSSAANLRCDIINVSTSDIINSSISTRINIHSIVAMVNTAIVSMTIFMTISMTIPIIASLILIAVITNTTSKCIYIGESSISHLIISSWNILQLQEILINNITRLEQRWSCRCG